MFLKRLELQGFKTFASKTEFVFDSGITAIVGPNGSGKSNIADAMRWVLGEQSPRALRIKRSDDVIFAGSSARPRVGMAEVSITLDNSTKWLPVDFSEVTITRRAYRSGESEYLLNKSRVRLRDIVDLLLAGNIGQNNYTVIGQGAIDAALSLRPEERRELFEEAADIKRYQLKRNDALAKLQATEANLVRLRDLMAEIAPRLQVLQEQAQRAQEQERLLQELRGYLAAWYGHRWAAAGEDLRRALSAEAEAQRLLDESEARLQDIENHLAEVREREGELRARLGEWHRQSSALHTQAETLERRMAVARATLDSLNRQQGEILDEIVPLQEQLVARQQDIGAAEGELEVLVNEQARRITELADLEQQASEMEQRRQSVRQRLEAAESDTFAATSAIAAAESSLAAVASRRRLLHDDMKQRQTQMEQHQATADSLDAAIATLRSSLTAQDAEIAATAQQRGPAQAAISALRKDFEAAQAALAAAHDERRALELRLDSLSRLQQSMAGYDAGVRSVLNAARSGRLAGVVGTVASLLRVPPQYEVAISAALGNHEQDIVIETWQAAESAVEHLRQTHGGRATFLPLDVIRGRQAAEKIDEAIGWGAELVEVSERHRSIAAYLLGRVLLVRDLNTARRILDRPAIRSIASIVTLAGDIVRPGGAITGGSVSMRSSGLLERERELADLPKRITAARATEKALDQKMAEAQAALHKAEEALVALDGRLATLQRQRDDVATRLTQRQRDLERWQREIAWLREQLANLSKDQADLDRQETALSAELAARRQQLADAQTLVAGLRQELSVIAGSELVSRVAEVRTAVALGEQNLRTQQTLLDNRRQDIERLAAQIAAKQQRAGELKIEAEAIAGQIANTQVEASRLSAEITALQEQIRPAEADIAGLEKERAQLLTAEAEERTGHSALERSHSQAAIEVQRARSELSKLQAQIEAEEGLGLKGYGLDEDDVKRMLQELAVPVQLSLAVGDGHAQADAHILTANPETLKRRIDSMRGQLRHLGPVNPNAIVEYEETLKRYTFLTSQSDDLEQAVKSLKTVIGELDDLMRNRFETTFEAVGREFRRYFTTLFGGGTAKLSLTDPDDLAQTGVDIVAQPPGKRLQSLALLSGGERALTATALLFAILTVHPTPFCVLDEVDAALDDANVGRFCDALRQLARRTQFIVITHNKGTMEMASSLYGISMGGDSTSKVLSLRLEEVAAAK